MAVLVEAISVVVRRDAIDQSLAGGWAAFVDGAPVRTLCTDGQLVRVGFLDPKHVEAFVEKLKAGGLVFLRCNSPVDFVVVDQQRGPTMECDWLEFAHIPFGGPSKRVAMCWFMESKRLEVSGIHVPAQNFGLATPEGWTFEGSMSEQFTFVPTDDVNDRPEFLRSDDGIDVYLDTATGREVFKPKN
jgi:hypothetical protein